MQKTQVTKTTIQTIKKLTKTLTYDQTARELTKRGIKTPRGKKPTTSFVNYVLNTYVN